MLLLLPKEAVSLKKCKIFIWENTSIIYELGFFVGFLFLNTHFRNKSGMIIKIKVRKHISNSLSLDSRQIRDVKISKDL